MSDTHNYQTVFIHIPQITSEHVMVGTSGGLSAVIKYGGWNPAIGHIVSCEHGITVFTGYMDMVEVLDEP